MVSPSQLLYDTELRKCAVQNNVKIALNALDYQQMIDDAKNNDRIIVIDSCHTVEDNIVIESQDKNVPYFRKFEKRKRY